MIVLFNVNILFSYTISTLRDEQQSQKSIILKSFVYFIIDICEYNIAVCNLFAINFLFFLSLKHLKNNVFTNQWRY